MQKSKVSILWIILFILTGSTYSIGQRNNNQENDQGTSRQSGRSDNGGKNNSQKNQKPGWGSTVNNAPRRTTVIQSPQSSQNNYHYREGVYYRPSQDGRFNVGPAPMGARIRTLPTGFTRVLLGGLSYFYYYGTFYRNVDQSSYEVVVPPVGAIVYDLPDGYEKFNIDGFTYYTYDGIYYKAFIADNGGIAYEVVGDVRR